MSAIRPKFKILSSSCKHPNFILPIDSTKKTLGFKRSCGVAFENFEFFRFLRGTNGGSPPIFFFIKNCLTPIKQKSNNRIPA